MTSRTSIRGIAATTATVVAGVGVAAGLNVTGAMGALTPSPEARDTSHHHRIVPVAAFTREAVVDHADVARGKQRADHRVAARKKARLAAKKAAARAAAARAAARTASRSQQRTYSGDPRSIARSMMSAKYGWGAGEFSCLDSLWSRESGWDPHASNPSSGAYGIPQALPGSKMGTMGSDWQDNPATQIAWGLSYVKSSYGTPCGAWSAFQSKGWY